MARRIRTIEVPKVADIPPGNITASEWIEAKGQVETAYTETTVQAALRFDPGHPMYGAQRGTLDTEPSSIVKAANRAAIQLAANDARDTGGTLVLKGDYWIDDTIQIQCHVDGASARLLINDTNINPAVLVGTMVTGSLWNKQVVLPQVRQQGKAGAGWSGNDVGVAISNCQHCDIRVIEVRNFSRNILVRGEDGGCVYNQIAVGISNNGKIGLDFETGPGGWVNENLFLGGRYQINSNEGAGAPGTRHIRVGASASGHAFNNNVFIKPSLEGDPEHNIEAGGVYNSVLYARWESPNPTVYFDHDAQSWTIEGGYDSHRLQVVLAPGNTAPNTRIRSRQYQSWRAGAGSAGVLRLANSSSDGMPVITVQPGGSTFWTRDLASDYYISIAGTAMKFKNFSDSYPRLEIQSATGNLVFGTGSVAPSYLLEVNQFGNMIWRGGSLFVEGAIVPSNGTQTTARIYAGEDDPNGTQAAGPGSLYLRTNGTIYRKGTGTGNTGWVAMS